MVWPRKTTKLTGEISMVSRWIIIISDPREGFLLHGGTCNVGEFCEKVSLIFYHTFSIHSLGTSHTPKVLL
jgi:hypothetical protein